MQTSPNRYGFATIAFFSISALLSAAPLELSTDAKDGMVVNGQSCQLNIRIDTSALPSGEHQLAGFWTDRFGRQTAITPIPIETSQASWQHELVWTPQSFGPEQFQASIMTDSTETTTESVSLVNLVPVPDLTKAERMTSPIGVNLRQNAHWESLQAMGIHWARDYSWDCFALDEPAPDGLAFDVVWQRAQDAGIEILPVLETAFRTDDKLYFVTDSEYIAQRYESFSRSFPEIAYWELDNEADLKHPDLNSPEYARWFASYLNYIEAASTGLMKAGHGAQVALNGEAGIWPARAQQWVDLRNEHFSVINYHYYTGPVPPETAENDFNTGGEKRPQSVTFLDMMRQINQVAHESGNEAWLTEIGWSAERGPAVGTLRQSAYLQRAYLLARWAGTEKVFWFWDRDLPGHGRFSDTGLLSGGQVQAAGAAMAMLSKMTARSHYLGSVDLGPDCWGLVFQQPDGNYLLTAWSLSKPTSLLDDFPMPIASYGMYGNSKTISTLTEEPAFLIYDHLPPQWRDHLDLEWLSPSLLNVSQGGKTSVRIQNADRSELHWAQLPEGVLASDWNVHADIATAELTIASHLPTGRYPITLRAESQTGAKSLRANLVVKPGIQVESESYQSGHPTAIHLQSTLEQAVTIALQADSGHITPEKIALAPGSSHTAHYTASDTQTKPVELEIQLSNGAKQMHRLRPSNLQISTAEQLHVDGDLSDWSESHRIPIQNLLVEGSRGLFTEALYLAWSPEGLYIAAQIEMGNDFRYSRSPNRFWEAPGLECYVQAEGFDAHQFWFTPTVEKNLYAGEWKGKETIYDDARMERALSVVGVSLIMEIRIPTHVFAKELKAGDQLHFALNTKWAKPLMPRTLNSWPNSFKPDPTNWGTLFLKAPQE